MILTINAFPLGEFCMDFNKELNVYIGSFPKQNNSLGGKRRCLQGTRNSFIPSNYTKNRMLKIY